MVREGATGGGLLRFVHVDAADLRSALETVIAFMALFGAVVLRAAFLRLLVVARRHIVDLETADTPRPAVPS